MELIITIPVYNKSFTHKYKKNFQQLPGIYKLWYLGQLKSNLK